MVVGALGLVPPPFPFTWYVLAAGALGVGRIRFLVFLAVARLVRTGVEASIAARHGRAIVRRMDSTSFEISVAVMIAAAVIGTGWTTWRAYRVVG